MAHSTLVGGSIAARRIACPASYQASIALPATANKSSEYADEGTAMHEVMENIMTARMADPFLDQVTYAWSLVGKQFYDREFTAEHYNEMIVPALMALRDLERDYGGGFKVAAVELSGAFPGIPSAFGTIDLILINSNVVLHVDWKFGAGVPVKARYDGRLNDQLAFYIGMAKHKLRAIYKDRAMAAAIIQPRVEGLYNSTPVTVKDLNRFKKDLSKAIEAALGRDPPRAKGEHCRFAECKLTCPLWTGPLLDLSALQPQQQSEPVSATVTPFAQYLHDAKRLIDTVEILKKEVDQQIHSYLDAGGTVPGWRLKHKVKARQWVDEATVEGELLALGFKDAEIWQEKLLTFTVADALAKKKGVTIPDHLRVAPPSSETTIAATDDPEPIVERALVIEQFRASLAALQQVGGASKDLPAIAAK